MSAGVLDVVSDAEVSQAEIGFSHKSGAFERLTRRVLYRDKFPDGSFDLKLTALAGLLNFAGGSASATYNQHKMHALALGSL